MCGFDGCTTVPRSLLALLPFPARTHVRSDKKKNTEGSCPTPTPNSPPLYPIHHLAQRNRRNVISALSALPKRLLALPPTLSLFSDAQCVPGTPLECEELRSRPRRLPHISLCPAPCDSFCVGTAGSLLTLPNRLAILH